MELRASDPLKGVESEHHGCCYRPLRGACRGNFRVFTRAFDLLSGRAGLGSAPHLKRRTIANRGTPKWRGHFRRRVDRGEVITIIEKTTSKESGDTSMTATPKIQGFIHVLWRADNRNPMNAKPGLHRVHRCTQPRLCIAGSRASFVSAFVDTEPELCFLRSNSPCDDGNRLRAEQRRALRKGRPGRTGATHRLRSGRRAPIR